VGPVYMVWWIVTVLLMILKCYEVFCHIVVRNYSAGV
jgi:hypothetical protein